MRRSAGSALALLVLGATTACGVPRFLVVDDPPDGVTVKALTADISFGESSAATQTVAALAPPAGLLLAAIPELLDLQDLPPLAPFAAPIPPAACPEVSDTTFPEKSAGFVAEGAPAAGIFRWRQEGEIEIVGLARIPAPALDVRRVRLLSSPGEGVQVYEFEQSSLAGREVQTIEVRQAGNAQTHGVFLTRFQLITSRQTLDFRPPALVAPKLFSLPIRTEAISATAVDPISGLTMTISGTVDGTTRARLEGCGEVFDAWSFKGSRVLQSVTDPEQAIRSTTYDTFFAPQYGGIFVGDHVVTTGSFGAIQYRSDIRATLGSIQPLARP